MRTLFAAFTAGIFAFAGSLLHAAETTTESPHSPVRPVRIVLVGDSTMSDYAPGRPDRGWGQFVAERFRPGSVAVFNHAKPGRSTKTFIKEGRWARALADLPDYVFLQFGHNDSHAPEKPESTDAATDYRDYLRRYIDDSRAAGATPILVTPMVRRTFRPDGTLDDNLAPYADAMKAVAAEKQVALIDLHASSRALVEPMGPEAAQRFANKRTDRTHFNETGARAMAALVFDALPANAPMLVPLLSGPPTSAAVAPAHAATINHGFGASCPADFAVPLPEGNYDVVVRLGHADKATSTTIKAESRRLMLHRVETAPGAFVERAFTVNIRQPALVGSTESLSLNDRELGPPISKTWDDTFALEFLGDRPGVASITITPAPDALTVFLAGDSTVTDQRKEPFAGWGQMLPRFFARDVAVSNHAESGLSLRSFERQKRLRKILTMLKPGDHVFIQFGHNDQKETGEGVGPFTTYKASLVRYVAAVRERGGVPVLITPMERRRWENGAPTTTLHDYAEAVRQVAAETHAPVIDLHAMSLKFYAALGEEGSKRAFVFYPTGSFGQDREFKDNTHHNNYGGYELARCVVEGIREKLPALATRLATDAGSFDPAEPDMPDALVFPLSPVKGPSETPAGS